MKVKTRSRRLVIAISVAVVLLGVTPYSAVSEACRAGKMARPALSGGRAAVTMRNLKVALPTQVSDAVTEWNEEAVRLTLLPSSALSPVQQARAMAIVQVAIHDAVNGITG